MGTYYSGVINSDYDSALRHFGILGQKWGVRRYQNKDGTLTEAGKKRYSDPNNVKKDIEEGIVDTWGRAVNKINKNIVTINNKYDGIDFNKDKKSQKAYEKEIWDMVAKVHIDQLNEEYGAMADQAKMGRKFLENYMPTWLEM